MVIGCLELVRISRLVGFAPVARFRGLNQSFRSEAYLSIVGLPR